MRFFILTFCLLLSFCTCAAEPFQKIRQMSIKNGILYYSEIKDNQIMINSLPLTENGEVSNSTVPIKNSPFTSKDNSFPQAPIWFIFHGVYNTIIPDVDSQNRVIFNNFQLLKDKNSKNGIFNFSADAKTKIQCMNSAEAVADDLKKLIDENKKNEEQREIIWYELMSINDKCSVVTRIKNGNNGWHLDDKYYKWVCVPLLFKNEASELDMPPSFVPLKGMSRPRDFKIFSDRGTSVWQDTGRADFYIWGEYFGLPQIVLFYYDKNKNIYSTKFMPVLEIPQLIIYSHDSLWVMLFYDNCFDETKSTGENLKNVILSLKQKGLLIHNTNIVSK